MSMCTWIQVLRVQKSVLDLLEWAIGRWLWTAGRECWELDLHVPWEQQTLWTTESYLQASSAKLSTKLFQDMQIKKKTGCTETISKETL